MSEIAPNVFRIEIPTPFPVGLVNCYLIDGHPLTLIDAGVMYPPAKERLQSTLEELGFTFSDVEQVLLTHGHLDHAGMAQTFVEARISSGQPPTSVYIHSEDWHRVVSHENYLRERMKAYLKMATQSGVPKEVMNQLGYDRLGDFFLSLGRSIPEARQLSDNDEIASGIGPLRVIWVPGHTHGCVCYVSQARRLIFTGDHVLKEISSNPSLEFDSPGIPLLNYLKSLDKVLPFDGYRVFPGHRDEIPNLAKRVNELKLDIESKLRRLSMNLSDRPLTIYNLSRQIYGDYDTSELLLALAETTDLVRVLEQNGVAKIVKEHGILLVRKRQ